MNARAQFRFWAIGILLAGVLLYLLRGVMLPFVAGMAVAFLFDPLADRLQKLGLSRVMATVVITVGFFLLLISSIVILAPLLAAQITTLAENLPEYLTRGRALIERLGGERFRQLFPADGGAAPEISGMLGNVVNFTGNFLRQALSGGLALFNLLALMFLTPIISFYLLLDWDRVVTKIDALLPLQHAPTIRHLARQVNDTLSGFVRGQVSVCLILATFYGIGLTLAGLNFGLSIGIIAGLLSFIPFFGALSGLIASLLFAFIQFWPDYLPIAIIAVIFFAGQALEGNILTPRLVGRRVGLHPLWVIFALLAFGTVFGLTGMLLALPLAAISGVLVRHFIQEYLASALYLGATKADTDEQPTDA